MPEDITNLTSRVAKVETNIINMTDTLSDIKKVLESIDSHIKQSIHTEFEVGQLKKEIEGLKKELVTANETISDINEWKGTLSTKIKTYVGVATVIMSILAPIFWMILQKVVNKFL